MLVLLAAKISSQFSSFLEQHYQLVDYSVAHLKTEVAGIVTSNKLLVDSAFMQQYPNLKWIARLGSGMEIIDIDYAKENGIACFSSAHGIANAVAEHAISMLLALQKNIIKGHLEMSKGLWLREENRGVELEGKTIGIIGYGHTGQAFVEKLQNFTEKILVYDKFKQQSIHPYAQITSLEEIYKHADIVSYHVPLKQDTVDYYEPSCFLKPHILINTSRGEVCKSAKVLEGFQSQKLIGACLDVFDFEKDCKPDHVPAIVQKLLDYPCVLTPHIAGYSHNAIEKMSAELIEQIKLQIG